MKRYRSKTFPISPLALRENRFFHTFSVSGGKRPWEHVTQGPAAGALKNPAGLESPLGRKPDSSLRARGPHGPAAALKG